MVTGNQSDFSSTVLPSPRRSIDEEDDAVLDEYILDDSHSTDMASQPFSPPHNFYASPQFVPQDEESWPSYAINYAPHSFPAVSSQSSAGSQSGHAPLHPDPPMAYPVYGEHPAPWQPINMGFRTSTDGNNGLSSPFDIKVEDNQASTSMPPPNAMALTGPSEQAPYGASVASPQSENGWMSASSASDRSNKNPARDAAVAANNRQFATFPTHMRREGIRKKNARVEIPDGRTIDTIEEEIKMCDPNDESKLKELKQYKRLLRNREAALSSRSRKKEHAQRLEEENKLLTASEEQLKMSQNYWLQQCQKLTQAVEKYQVKEEDIVRRHTLETAELRKKISFLTEELQSRADIPLPTAPNSATFPHAYPDFDSFAMNGSSPQWDKFSFGNTGGMTAESQKPHETPQHAQHKDVKPNIKEEEPAVSGLLLMLLLCGAWVTSTSSSTKQVTVPEMPEDVRAASAAVLTNIYKDAGLQPHDGMGQGFDAPPPFGPLAGSHKQSQGFGQPFDTQSFHQQLTDPTRQQQREQAFSLSAEQYNHITTDFYGERSKAAMPTRRRNLADALANLHVSRRTSATDAYTKSLLVDEVPANVVRDFHRMVAERNNGPAPQ